MSVLMLQNITLYFQDRCIFDSISLQLNNGDKACLVGANGTGKTTLFNVISGRQQQDEGEVVFSKGSACSYLMQEMPSLDDGRTVEEELLSGSFKGVQEEFQKQKAITPLLDGFGFSLADRKRKCRDFSMGWQMRIALVKALASGADFLLLDEPTNYLDIECRIFLRDFLRKTPSGFLIVSHDRYFLDSVCKTTYELLAGDIIKYSGNYSFYEKQKEEAYERLEKERDRREKEKREITEFIERFRSKPTKARQVQERIKRLEKIEDVEIFEKSKSVHFSFPATSGSPAVLLDCDRLSLSYDGTKNIISDFTFSLEKGDRVAVIGGNGMGKTTLLKLFSGALVPTGGTMKSSDKTICGYFSQDAFAGLNSDNTIFDEIKRCSGFDDAVVKSMLGAFLFSGDDAAKRIGVLSGGEKARVAICKMLLSPSNLLLLDEITNHLDISSKNVLKKALLAFHGSMVFVSHDIDFIRDIANKVIYLDKNGHHVFLGDFSYFTYKVRNDVSLGSIAFARMDDDAGISTADALRRKLSSDASQPSDRLSSDCVSGDSDAALAGRMNYEEAKRKRNEENALKRKLEMLEKKEEELKSLIEEQEGRLSLPEVYSDSAKSGECAAAIEKLKLELEEVENEYFSLM